MKMVPYDINEVGYYKKTKNFELLTEFANSEYDCVMVKDFNHKSAKHCVTALNSSARHFKLDNIIAFERRGMVFLVKKSAIG